MRDDFGLWGMMRAFSPGDRVRARRPGAAYDNQRGTVRRVTHEPEAECDEGAVAVWVDFPCGVVVVCPRDLWRLPDPPPAAPRPARRGWWRRLMGARS